MLIAITILLNGGGQGTEQYVQYATICGGKKANKNMYTYAYAHTSKQTLICV